MILGSVTKDIQLNRVVLKMPLFIRDKEMARMVFDESMWKTLKKLLPAPKGRHGGDEDYF